MSYNIDLIDSMHFASKRNYAPKRTFVTKWDVEIKKNRTKKLARSRDRDAKYYDYYDDDSVPEFVYEYFDDEYEYYWDNDDMNMNDGDGEETLKRWFKSIHNENAYYEKYFNI